MKNQSSRLIIPFSFIVIVLIVVLLVTLYVFQQQEQTEIENIFNNEPATQEQAPVESTIEEVIDIEFTKTEVAEHNNLEDCYVIVENKVYDIPMTWIEEHPGGQEVFVEGCGKDISEDFQTKHTTEEPKTKIKEYRIGKIVDSN